MHAKPDFRVFLEWMIAGSGSVITDVMRLKDESAGNLIGDSDSVRLEFHWITNSTKRARLQQNDKKRTSSLLKSFVEFCGVLTDDQTEYLLSTVDWIIKDDYFSDDDRNRYARNRDIVINRLNAG